MKRIYYINGSVVTGDRTAETVLAYAQALAQSEGSDTIDIPVIGELGETGRAQLLIGPASQLMVVTQLSTKAEFDDDEAIARIEKRILGLTRPLSRPADPGPDGLSDAEGTYLTE